MKKLFYPLFVLLSVALIACSNDDSDALSKPDPIIGKWILTTQYVDEKPVVLSDCEKNIYYVFNENSYEYKIAETTGESCSNNLKTGTWKREYTGKYLQNQDGVSEVVFRKFAYMIPDTDVFTQMIEEVSIGKGDAMKTYKRIYKKQL